jgi:hypothetical protein
MFKSAGLGKSMANGAKNTAKVFFNLPKQVERIPLDDFMSEFQYGTKDAKGGIIS